MSDEHVKQLEARVGALAHLGRYQTPECSYLAARLEYIRDGDPDAFDRMLRCVTLKVPE